MANQTVVSAAAIWQAYFETLTNPSTELDFTKQGQVYFVEKNAGNDEEDGLDWEHAFRTIAYAIETSNTNIGANQRGWASRNKIYIKGDFTETLTTAPEKCDLIGVGSTNARPRPRITGAQAMTTTAWGTRFINIEFRGVLSSATMTWTAGGFEIHDCVFSQPAGITMGTHAITIVNPTDVIIRGCVFEMTNEAFFSTACIYTTSTALINRFKIQDCTIRGAVGVLIRDTGDDHHYDCTIERCNIYASGLPINDKTGMVQVIDCNLISQGSEDVSGMSVLYAANNIYTSSTDTRNFPFITNT